MSVRKVDVADATESLAAYVQEADAGPVVVMREGRPVAALILLEDTDLETIALSTDPGFQEIIQSSRDRQTREGGLSSTEIRRRLADEP